MAFNQAEARSAFRAGKHLGEVTLSGNPRDVMDQAFGGMVNAVVGGIFAVALGVVMLNQLFSLSIINTTTGPFATLFDTVENIGGAAITFIVLGFLAAAGGLAVRMFRG